MKGSKLELSVKLSEGQFKKNLQELIKVYENEIKSNIFTIELLWRELIGLYSYNKDHRIQNILVKDIFIELKREEIFDQQPFELIDGDILEMPQEIITETFKSLEKDICIVTVLGPQSSGKSTLLNFLFGCSFTTSIGRCTRGVYGTYFDLEKQSEIDCQGIFLVDTEGIMANTNKKD